MHKDGEGRDSEGLCAAADDALAFNLAISHVTRSSESRVVVEMGKRQRCQLAKTRLAGRAITFHGGPLRRSGLPSL